MGCVFCDPRGFTAREMTGSLALEKQISLQIEKGKTRGITRFMAYFQPYTNTYALREKLKCVYDTILAFPEICALAIGTRPDCVDEDKLNLIAEYTDQYEVWVEYGLQSIHDATLQRLNRGHDAAAFFRALELTRRHSEVRVCVHVILGLPGETAEHEQQTAQTLGRLHVEGVKLHPLYIVKDTALALAQKENPIPLLTQSEYVERAGRFLEQLWPETIIQRLTADCPEDVLLAPLWLPQKTKVIQALENWLQEENTWQGKAYPVLEK
jgi:radical SAM protein (TIGR01212 family)